MDITSNLSKYADDTKIGLEDCRALQDDLDKLYDRSVKWKMAFNIDRCKIILLDTCADSKVP